MESLIFFQTNAHMTTPLTAALKAFQVAISILVKGFLFGEGQKVLFGSGPPYNPRNGKNK